MEEQLAAIRALVFRNPLEIRELSLDVTVLRAKICSVVSQK